MTYIIMPSLAGKVATSVAKLTDEFPEGRLTAENVHATEIVAEA